MILFSLKKYIILKQKKGDIKVYLLFKRTFPFIYKQIDRNTNKHFYETHH